MVGMVIHDFIFKEIWGIWDGGILDIYFMDAYTK